MNQQRCQECGCAAPPEAKFCPACGAPIASRTTKSVQQEVTVTKKQTSKRDLLILGVTLLIVTVGYFTFKQPEAVPKNPDTDVQAHSDMPVEDMGDVMRILQDLPTDYTSLVALGNRFMDEHNYAVAAECYRRALAIEGDSLNVRVDYGACLHGMGLPYRAIEEFRTVIDADPSHAVANFNLGIVYYDLNELDSARVYWQKYLEIDPNGKAAEAARQLLKEIDG